MQDANSKIKHLNEVVYSYFSENCGQGENLSNKTFNGKYNDHSAKDLKKILKKLKATQGVNVNEIKYVSCVLRDRLSGKDHSEQDCAGELDHDKHINKSFWGYIKTIMNKKESVLPSFSMSDCASYFMKTLSSVNPNKLFIIPNFICFKRCPILRTYLTEIIQQVWSSGMIPTEWKKTCTTLIHKKGQGSYSLEMSVYFIVSP